MLICSGLFIFLEMSFKKTDCAVSGCESNRRISEKTKDGKVYPKNVVT
jgi:hypothetical protein